MQGSSGMCNHCATMRSWMSCVERVSHLLQSCHFASTTPFTAILGLQRLLTCMSQKLSPKAFASLRAPRFCFHKYLYDQGICVAQIRQALASANKLKAWIWACIGRVIAACVFHDRLLKHLSTSDMPDPSMQVHSYGYNSKWMHLSHYLKAMLLQSLLMWALMKPIH